MFKRLLTALIISIFYIFWVPLSIIKDFFALSFISFDMNRMFKTYQQFMNNLYAMTNFHKHLNENEEDIGSAAENTLYKQQNIGFIDTEEIYEEEEDH